MLCGNIKGLIQIRKGRQNLHRCRFQICQGTFRIYCSYEAAMKSAPEDVGCFYLCNIQHCKMAA